MVGTPSKINKYCQSWNPFIPSKYETAYVKGPDSKPESVAMVNKILTRKLNSCGLYTFDNKNRIPGMYPLSAAL